MKVKVTVQLTKGAKSSKLNDIESYEVPSMVDRIMNLGIYSVTLKFEEENEVLDDDSHRPNEYADKASE